MSQSSPEKPEVIPPKETSLLDHAKNIAGKLLGPGPVTVEGNNNSPENPETNQNPAGDSFSQTADATIEKYSAAGQGGSGEPANAGAPDGGQGASNAAEVPLAGGHFVSPDLVESFLVMLTEGLAKHHGEHWRMSAGEKTFLVPVNVAMLDEQGPKLFGHLENPALWTWALVMSGWIGTKSESVGKAVTGAIEKLMTFGAKKQ